MAPSPFAGLLGPAAARLPAAVRKFHQGDRCVASGRCSVTRGASPVSRPIARLARLPGAAGDLPITVERVFDGRHETWTRRFADTVMPSRLHADGGLLVEQLGPARLSYRLHADAGGLTWETVSLSALGLPLPLGLFRILARETEERGRYCFHVRAEIRGIGLVVEYRGWLDV